LIKACDSIEKELGKEVSLEEVANSVSRNFGQFLEPDTLAGESGRFDGRRWRTGAAAGRVAADAQAGRRNLGLTGTATCLCLQQLMKR